YERYLARVVPAIARRVASDPESYVYLAESIQSWPTQAELAAMMAAAGWQALEWRNLSAGIVALHRGRRPYETPCPVVSSSDRFAPDRGLSGGFSQRERAEIRGISAVRGVALSATSTP